MTFPAPSTDYAQIADVTIIGGGPTGLAAAYYAGHREASVRIIESPKRSCHVVKSERVTPEPPPCRCRWS